MQLVFFYLSHSLIKAILKCFNLETMDYCNISIPEVSAVKIKA